MKFFQNLADFLNENADNKNQEIYSKYYSDIDKEVYDKIIQIQPKKRNYKDWLLNLYRNNRLKLEDLYKAEEYLLFFDRPNIKSKLGGENFIKTLDSIQDLYQSIKDYKNTELSSNDIKKQVQGETVVKEFENYNLFIPQTYEQSCKLGSGTQWCTASGLDRTAFDDYSKKGPLFIFISKDDPKEKYQLHLNDGQFMDINDNPVELHDFFNDNSDIEEYILTYKNNDNLLGFAKLLQSDSYTKEFLENNPNIHLLLQKMFSNLSPQNSQYVTSNINFFKPDGSIVFYYLKKDQYVCTIYTGLWDILLETHHLSYEMVRVLLIYFIEHKFRIYVMDVDFNKFLHHTKRDFTEE